MAANHGQPKAGRVQISPAKGTEKLGYWEFRKQFCKDAGWQLRRTAPQQYEVLNDQRKKIGVFRSGEGYFPDPEGEK